MIVGLVPAAGYARRLGELSGSKEMLAVDGRPVIDHLIERMRAVHPDEIRVITRPDKTDVISHVESLGVELVVGCPASVSESLMMGTAGLDGDDNVLFGFPDTIWQPVDGFAAVLAGLVTGVEASLGLFRIADGLQRSDVVTLDAAGERVLRIAVKPSSPESDLIWGCAATRVRVIDKLGTNPEPGVCFGRLALEGAVAATVLSDSWLDIGTPESLESARLLFG